MCYGTSMGVAIRLIKRLRLWIRKSSLVALIWFMVLFVYFKHSAGLQLPKNVYFRICVDGDTTKSWSPPFPAKNIKSKQIIAMRILVIQVRLMECQPHSLKSHHLLGTFQGLANIIYECHVRIRNVIHYVCICSLHFSIIQTNAFLFV